MKKDIRVAVCVVIIILLAILCIYSLIADKEDDEKNPQVPDTTAVPTQRTIILPDKDENKVVLDTVRYYTVKLSSKKIESVEAAVGQGVEISPKVIVEYITDSLADEEIDVDVLGTELKDGVCIFNLGDSIKKVAEKDAALEKLVLDAFSMSILDNCKDVYAVTFKINGETYSSKNISINDGEVYLKS